MSELNVKMPSGSSLKRVKACLASQFKPHVYQQSDQADEGTAKHLFLELTIGKGMSVEEAIVPIGPKHRKACLEIDLDAIPKMTEVMAEVTFAFDPLTKTARILGQGLNRDYSGAKSHEIVGTADRFGYVERDGRVIPRVDDYKTGGAFDVDPANQNDQIRFLGLCVSLLPELMRGSDVIEVSIVRTLGRVKDDPYTMDQFDLAAELDSALRLSSSLIGIAKSGNVPPPVEGSHCKYCPAFEHCEAKTSMIRKMVNAPALTAEGIMSMITHENASQAYARYREIKSVLRKMDMAFRKWAEKNPIKTSNGKVWGPVESQAAEIDPSVAFEVLSELYGIEVAKAACSFDTSKTAIKNAIASANNRDGSIAFEFSKAMKAIAGAGGIEVKTKTKYEES